MKTCSHCKQEKAVSEFYKRAKSKDGLKSRCKECCKLFPSNSREAKAIVAKRWRENNPAKHLASVAKWRQNNPEKHAGYTRRWRKANPIITVKIARLTDEEKKARDKVTQRAHYDTNKDAVVARNNKWNKANRAKVNTARRKWNAENPEAVRVEKHTRRARLTGNGGSYTANEWQALLEHCDYICQCCGEEKDLTVDHIIPVTLGGTSNIDNLQPLCQPCNSSKGAKIFNFLGRV